LNYPFKKTIQKIQASRSQKKSDFIYLERLQQRVIQAVGTEGMRDILSFEVVEGLINAEKQPNKNNYKTYGSQVEQIYKMYFNESDYGGETARGLIDTRVSLECGEGMNVVVYDSPEFTELQKEKKKIKVQAFKSKSKYTRRMQALLDDPKEEEIKDLKKESVETFIDKFIDDNQLDGSGLFDICETGEREGKVLLVLNLVNDKIKINIFNWYTNKYDVVRNSETGDIESITYIKNGVQTPIALDRAVFIQLYGLKTDPNKTPPRIANVLTQIENRSRARYDLRYNNHLYAKNFLWFETQDKNQSDAIKNWMKSNQFNVSKSGAGQARPYYVTPDTSISTTINLERTMDLKDIANAMGIPVFFNDPELISNKSLGDMMLEQVNQSTKKERLILESALKELIQKAMQLGVNSNIEGAVYKPDMFGVNLPLITFDTLKNLIEVWGNLFDKGFVSKQTVMGKIPGINPMDEEKLIEQEKKDNIENNPLNEQMSNVMDGSVNNEEDKLLKDEPVGLVKK
jgi:hypothetical protein